MITRRSKNGVALAAFPVAALLLTGCGSDGGEDDETVLPVPSEQEPAPDDEAQPDDAGQDQDDLNALYERYWDVMVTLENSEDMPEPDIFDGIAGGELLERQMARVRNFKDSGQWRQGEPVVEQITVEVDGDDALIQACVNEDDWDVLLDGEVVPLAPEGSTPRVMEAERTDEGWLLARTQDAEEATITC
ncbi:hypothetical protein [Streptomyces otsuchiensis]|uniref:hypothetical protein n=1 Tax=Streptomyces otsuchiensis TaxID=2681388 RepID=UPI001030560E|nr:hypothetical protein [Streptomyces otsuchiensis]